MAGRKAALYLRVGISGGARPIPVDMADAGHIQELGGQNVGVPKEEKLKICELEGRSIVLQVLANVPVLQQLSPWSRLGERRKMELEPSHRREMLLYVGHCAGCLVSTVSLNPLIIHEAGSSLPTVSRGEGRRLREENPLLQSAQLMKDRI